MYYLGDRTNVRRCKGPCCTWGRPPTKTVLHSHSVEASLPGAWLSLHCPRTSTRPWGHESNTSTKLTNGPSQTIEYNLVVEFIFEAFAPMYRPILLLHIPHYHMNLRFYLTMLFYYIYSLFISDGCPLSHFCALGYQCIILLAPSQKKQRKLM